MACMTAARAASAKLHMDPMARWVQMGELHLASVSLYAACLSFGDDDWHIVAVCFGTTRPLSIELSMRGPPLWLEAEVLNAWSQAAVRMR